MDELLFKLDNLVKMLNTRANPSSKFFYDIKENLQKSENIIGELDSLIKAYPITQYANFSKKEEDILDEIITIARHVKKQIV